MYDAYKRHITPKTKQKYLVRSLQDIFGISAKSIDILLTITELMLSSINFKDCLDVNSQQTLHVCLNVFYHF